MGFATLRPISRGPRANKFLNGKEMGVKRQSGLGLFLVVAFFGLTSCASQPKPELEKSIDEVFAKSSEKTYANSGARPLAVGQWALYRITDESGESLFRWFGSTARGYRYVGVMAQEGNGFWIEERMTRPDGEESAAVLVENFDLAEVYATRFVKFRVLNDGEVVELDADADDEILNRVRERATAYLHTLSVSDVRTRIRDIKVPAGTFEDAVPAPISLNLKTGRQVGHVWFTDAVPSFRVARQVTTTLSFMFFWHSRTEELVSFGDTGAQLESVFFRS